MRRALTIALLALLLAAACGDEETIAPVDSTTTTDPVATTADPVATTADGDGSQAGKPDEAADDQRPLTIGQTVETVLTSSAEPAVICDEFVTAAYVRTAYGAREGCLAAQKPGALAESVGGGAALREGNHAGVTVVPEGGPYDGVEVEVELVEEGDTWRVDSLLADVPAGP